MIPIMTKEFNLNKLREIKKEKTPNIFLERLAMAILKEVGVTMSQIRSQSRKSAYVMARRIYVYYCLELDMRLCSIGERINKNHSTVSFYKKTFESELKYNADFRYYFERVTREIGVTPFC